MPYARRYRKIRTRRSRRSRTRASVRTRKSRGNPQGSGLVRRVLSTPFPSRMIVNLKYNSGLITLTPGAISNHHEFNSNSVFDPDYTGIGGQPLWRDQISPLYSRYRVTACKVSLVGKQTTAGVAGFLCIHGAATGKTPYTTIDDLIENKQKFQMTKIDQNIRMNRTFLIRKMDSLSDREFKGISGYAANTGSNPAYMPKIWISASSFDNATTVNIDVRVTLTYTVEFYDLNYPTPS